MRVLLKIISFVLLFTLALSAAFVPVSAEGAYVNSGAVFVSAESAALIDASDGSVLYAKNATTRLPMASTTKVMTAIVAIEHGNLDAVVEIPRAAVGIEGSSIYLFEGEKLTLGNLVYALLLASANDAATAIAIIVAGGVKEFAVLMNEKAADLGLENTHFENPHGLDAETHYTTALDLARIAAYGLRNETFKKIVSTYKTTIPLNSGEGTRVLVNHNKMLRTYDGAIGVKTGYTRRSGRCLVSAAERGGLTLVAVTINAPNDWSDHTKMLDYGFSAYVSVNLAEAGAHQVIMPVSGGVSDWVVISNTEEIKATLPVGHGKITVVVEAPHFMWAAVSIGDAVGRLIFYCDGKVIGESPLIAVTAAEAVPKSGFFAWLRGLFGLD